MGKIDLQKLQDKLTRENIIIIEYYCIDYECYYIKCFLTLCYEFIVIYIPKDYRFHVSESNPVVYNIESKNGSEIIEVDDYTKTGVSHDIDLINEDKSTSTYKDLKSKYQHHITLEAEEEPVLRKLKRQMDRLCTPFSKINYTLFLQRGKYFITKEKDPNGNDHAFIIKRYNKDPDGMNIAFLISLPQLIQDLDELSVNIQTIGKQFNKIIKRVAFSNLNEIESIPDVQRSSMLYKIEEYEKHINEYIRLHTKTLRDERELLQKNDTTNSFGTSILFGKRDPHSILRDMSKSKIQMVEKGIQFVQHFHKKILLLEEISFDNNIMINRIEKNFDLLAKNLL